jgi:hypothetical protein
MKINKKDLFLFLGILCCLLIYIVYMVCFGIGTFADPLRGFEILQQYTQGANWNTLNYPNPHGSYRFFVAWWAPAQWYIPYLLMCLLGNHFQLIQQILVVVCSVVGLYFYYRLFLRLNFSRTIALTSLLIIVTNQLFYWHFFLYYGGDLFVLAYFPVLVLFLLKLSATFNIKNLLTFFACSLLGIFLKNCFLIFTLAGCIFIIFNAALYQKIHIAKLFALLFTTLIIFTVGYFAFLKYGVTPSQSIEIGTYDHIPNTYLNDFFVPFASVFGIFSRILPISLKAVAHSSKWTLLLEIVEIMLFTINILVFIFYFRKNGGDKQTNQQKNLLVYFVLPILCAFFLLYIKNVAISYEMRHFAPLSFLLTPIFIAYISPIRLKKFLFSVILLVCFTDILLFAENACQLKKDRSYFGDVLLQKSESQLLNKINLWDKHTKNGLIVSENYWLPIFGKKNNDKIGLRLQKTQWHVVSGMEIDSPPLFSVQGNRLEKYSSLLLVCKQSENQLINEITNFRVRKKEYVGNFYLYCLEKK